MEKTDDGTQEKKPEDSDLAWKLKQIENMKAGRKVVIEGGAADGLFEYFCSELKRSVFEEANYAVHDPIKKILYFRRRSDWEGLYKDVTNCWLKYVRD